MQLAGHIPPERSISPAASFHSFSYSASDLISARAANSAGGGNSRASCITVSSWPADKPWAAWEEAVRAADFDMANDSLGRSKTSEACNSLGDCKSARRHGQTGNNLRSRAITKLCCI